MILIRALAKNRQMCNKVQFRFNEMMDPYYILGVDRSMSYEQIKKEYFKLAQKYHPDINEGTDSAAKFIQIKEAFENIKMQNGKMVVQSFEGSKQPRSKYQSQRPDAQQYEEGDMGGDGKMDYQEFVFRTPKGQEYDKYRESFMTMHEINDKYFRPIQNVDMPDPAKRFGLQSLEVKLKKFGDRGQHFIISFSILAIAFFLVLNKNVNQYMVDQYENMFYNMLNRDEFEQFQKTQEEIDMSITQNFREQKKTQENIERIKKMEQLGQAKMDNYVPRFHEYTSLTDIRENINRNIK